MVRRRVDVPTQYRQGHNAKNEQYFFEGHVGANKRTE
ncbi:hypothetical protein HC024_22550 [Methylococcaceae bacterium WWC4]|nr:hypothetical protein [Methylococcaceae bacterium WWC4]